MHNHLIRLMILTGTLIVILAGLSPRKLHAATLNPVSGPVIPANSSSSFILTGKTDVRLTATQSLGSLSAIAWNNLKIADSHPFFSQLLILPAYGELQSQRVVGVENVVPVGDASAESYKLPSAINILARLHLYSETWEGTGQFCFACHASQNSLYQATATLENEHALQPVSYSKHSIACKECHIAEPKQVSRQFRGVE